MPLSPLTKVSRLGQAISAIGKRCADAINEFGVETPMQVLWGYPNFEDLTKELQQFQSLVTLYTDDSGVKNTSRWMLRMMLAQSPDVRMAASATDNILTFSGVPTPGVNVHLLFGHPLQDAYFQTALNDTITTVAAKAAVAINALEIPGVFADASGAMVTVEGISAIKCNIGGSGKLAMITRMVARPLQISIWSPNQDIRDQVYGALEVGLGGEDDLFVPMDDGTNVYCRHQTDIISDEKQRDYLMYIAHFLLAIEYPVVRLFPATQIGAFKTTYQLNGDEASLSVIEG